MSGLGVHQDVLMHFNSIPVGIGAYYSPDDRTQHAIVGTNDGQMHALVANVDTTLSDIYWRPGQSIIHTNLTTFTNQMIATSSYYTVGDNMRHAIVGTQDGALTEVHW